MYVSARALRIAGPALIRGPWGNRGARLPRDHVLLLRAAHVCGRARLAAGKSAFRTGLQTGSAVCIQTRSVGIIAPCASSVHAKVEMFAGHDEGA